MELPDNAIGVTDIQSYRDCPRRFEFGMRRHTQAGAHPQALTSATAYGSAIHDAIQRAEDSDASDDDAVQRAFDRFSKWLDPEDLARLRRDLTTYRQRDPTGVRTIACERDFRLPLFEDKGTTIYFRGRIDRLYQRLDDPSRFIHVDYKSSRHPRSQADVDSDVQLWAYNYAIFDEYPECEDLEQIYEQLEFGPLRATRKNDRQRELIRDWLIHQARAILRDSELEHRHNQWCAWCPIIMDCPVIPQLTEYALAEIDAADPEAPDGPGLIDVYVEELERVGQAEKVLATFSSTVKRALLEMPQVRRRALGYDVGTRAATSFGPDAMRAAHDRMGDQFYDLVTLPAKRLDNLAEEDRTSLKDLGTRHAGSTILRKAKGAKT